MKESEFIELLNLYVDHEISPADAERLEAEVLAVPERRRIYHEYCLMHKACSLLAGHFQDQAAQAQRIRPRSAQRFLGQPAVYAGLFAAACAAFLLVVRIRTAPVAPLAPAPIASAAARPDQAPALASAPAGADLSRFSAFARFPSNRTASPPPRCPISSPGSKASSSCR